MVRHRILPAMLLLILFSGCGAPDAGVGPLATVSQAPECATTFGISAPESGAPTAAPVPTAAPAPTPPPAPTEDVPPPAMSDNDRAATAVALATAQPFPAAGPATVQIGAPAQARGVRGGLSLTVALPSDHLLAGEATRATLTLRNDDPDPVFIGGDGKALGWLRLQDERGEEAAPWPWSTAPMPGGMFLLPLAPGQAISATLTLQTPPAKIATGHRYTLWAATRFARALPGAESPDNIWLHLEAGPLPLALAAPHPEQLLQATLAIDRNGYAIRVTGTRGEPAAGAWGQLEASFSVSDQFESYTAHPLDTGSSQWSGGWDGQLRPEQARIAARAWVAAPGYVTAALTQTVSATPLTPAEQARAFWSSPAPCRQRFSSPAAAQAALKLPLARLDGTSLNTTLAGVDAEILPGWATITTRYDPPDAAWLDLTQRLTSEQERGARWGEARYDPEAREVAVGSARGYLIQQYSRWVLNWELGASGLELRAPAAAVSADDLIGIAARVALAP